MNELDQLQMMTVEDGGIMLYGVDKDEKEHEKNPGYIYYYYTNNHTLTEKLDSQVTLEHRDSSRTIVSSSYRDDGGDAYVSVGKYYDEAHDVNVLSGGSLRITSSQCVSRINIGFGGSVEVNSTYLADYLGYLQDVEVQSGGTLTNAINGNGTVSCVYVHSGAVLVQGAFYETTLAANALCGTTDGFENLSDKDQTFAQIYTFGSRASAYVCNQTLTDLKCRGNLFVSSGGIISGGEFGSGSCYVDDEGMIEDFNVVSGGRLTIHGAGSNFTIQSGGSVNVGYNQGYTASLQDVEVQSGGSLSHDNGTVSCVYVHSGAVLVQGAFYETTLAANALCGTTDGFENLSDKDQTFAQIYTFGSRASAYVCNQTLTDLKCRGNLFVSSGGIISGGAAASGANWNVTENGIVKQLKIDDGGRVTVSGGRLEQSFDVAGKLSINGSGVARIWSASTIEGESASLDNYGTIEFLVASATLGGEALLNDYTKVNGWGGYSITVSGDQQTGEYRLIGNAASFNKNVTITVENTEFSGTFQWNGSGYDTVKLDDRPYTLKIDESNNLVLDVGMNPTRVNYEFTDVGQTVYYNGEKPEGCTLEGVLMAIPYTADITVSLDKTLAEGLYEFTTSIAEVDGSVNRFQIQISEGLSGSEGEPAPKFVTYNSSDMCIFGTLVGETASTMTYKFTGVTDNLLIDSIPDYTLTLDIENANERKRGSYTQELISRLISSKIEYKTCKIYPDVNKKRLLKYYVFSAVTLSDGKPVSIKIDSYPGDNDNYRYYSTITLHQNTYRDVKTDVVVDETKCKFVATVHTKDECGLEDDIVVKIDTKSNNAIISGIDAFGNVTTGRYGFQNAPWDDGHCWIATAVNMLYAAGYLDMDPQKCYETLNKNYYLKDGESASGSPTRVFFDFLYKKLGVSYDNQDYCRSFGKQEREHTLESTIEKGLKLGFDHIASCKGKIATALSYLQNGTDDTYHVITCYEFEKRENGADYQIIYSDSDLFEEDFFVAGPKNDGTITQKEAGLFFKNDVWYVKETYSKGKEVEGKVIRLITLIANNTGKKLTEDDISNLDLITSENNTRIYAVKCTGLETEDEWVTVSGNIYDSVVMGDSSLVIAADAEAEEMVVHAGGTVKFSSGSIVKGPIRTTGGTLMVESGVDVSEAEFNFVVSRMDGRNNTVMLNDLSNVSDARLTITIVNGQKAGKYVLAGGAADFNGTLFVVGELDYLRDYGEGFEDGFIGELGLDNTLSIERRTYSLVLEEDKLALVISAEKESPLGIVGDFNGDGRAMLVTESDNTFAVYSDGAAWGGLTLDDGWYVAGIGDFNGDGADDFLRVNGEGYVVGEMSNGNGTFTPQVLNFLSAGWDILGTGNFDGVCADDVLIANPTAASDTVGLLGYWKGGTEWTLINGYSPEWTMVSTGDFDGDGKCDMLWKNEFVGEGGLTYNAYCTWIVENDVDWRMVSVANPDEWNFLCSGDFDGNGAHDIAMINDVGVVGIWGVSDGYLSSWSILSAVDPFTWTLAGVGDFNADGTDDIAWSNTSTGLTGYWQINDKELTTWANIATL